MIVELLEPASPPHLGMEARELGRGGTVLEFHLKSEIQ
jgi:hypothetical protein